MLSNFRRVRGEKGFALIELLIIIAIIGILAAIAIPQFGAYKNRLYKKEAKANLQTVFQTCKAYWADNAGTDNCVLSTIKEAPYSYRQSSDINIAITISTEASFVATATHTLNSDSTTYTIDSSGNIR